MHCSALQYTVIHHVSPWKQYKDAINSGSAGADIVVLCFHHTLVQSYSQYYSNTLVNEDDDLPKKICDDCCKQLTEWKSFYKKSVETQKKLERDLALHGKAVEDNKTNYKDSSEFTFLQDCDKKAQPSSQLKENGVHQPPSKKCKKNPSRIKTGLRKGKCQKIERNKQKKGKKNESTNQDKPFSDQNKSEVDTELQLPECEIKHDGTDTNVTEITLHECHICGKTFTEKSKLHRHIALHKNAEQEHKCELCNKLFKSKFSLSCHAFTHSEKRNFCCHICGQLFRTASCLCNHVKLHSDVKQFECSLCGKAFRQSNHLDQHMRVHTGERPFHCSECNHRFTTSCQLSRHVQGVHRQIKKYKCNTCDKEFLYNSNYKAHLLRHEGQKNMKCDLCDKSFVTSNGLLRHRRFHTREKPFKCNVCGKTFADCSNRKRHMIQHLDPKPQPRPRNRHRKLSASSLLPPPNPDTVIVRDAETNEPKTYTSLRTFLESSEVIETLTGGRAEDEEPMNVEYVTLMAANDTEFMNGVQEVIMLPKEGPISEYEQLLNNVISQDTFSKQSVPENKAGSRINVDNYQSVDVDCNDLVEVFLTPKCGATENKMGEENVNTAEKQDETFRKILDTNNLIEVFLETPSSVPVVRGIDENLMDNRVQVYADGTDESNNLITVLMNSETNNKDAQNDSSFFSSDNLFDKESIIRMLNSQGTTVA